MRSSPRVAEVGGILDYAAEAKDGELPEIVKPTEEVSEQDLATCNLQNRSTGCFKEQRW